MSIKCPDFLNISELKEYTCVKYLGKGTFGVTYLLKDKYSRKVAVKMIPLQEKIDLEVSILKKLTNDCSKKRILCYHKYFNTDEFHYIITEYINGSSLSDYKIRKKNIVYKFIGQLIDAVEYIHSLGVVHFDIKPANIMITDSEDLKLIDFGAAGMPAANTPYNITTKTQFYAPPRVEWTVKNFKCATYFDWYTVITTIRSVIKGLNFMDIEGLIIDIPYNSKIIEVIQDIKMVVVNKLLDKTSSKSIDNFLKPEYISSVRNIFEKMIIKSDKKSLKTIVKSHSIKTIVKKVCPPGKILNPKTNRCVNINGAIGKKLV